MTSQKRYRHHQDNSNNRYRDLPPRFKRQKSSSSPPPTSTGSQSTQVSTSQKHSPSDKVLKNTDLREPAMSPVHISSPVMYAESYGNQDRVRTDIFQTPQPIGSQQPWCWPSQRSENGSVSIMSEGDNRLRQSQSPVAHVSLGTHFGYRTTSPPVSPWNAGTLPPSTSCVPNATWSNTPQNDSFRNQNLLSPPGFYNNENRAPQGFCQLSPGSQWNRPTFSPLQNQNLAPVAVVEQSHASPSLPRKSSETPKMTRDVEKSGTKRDVDYSDPDIRTIEMLRELERVADQKESEGDDFGADRKSLVSHHLRMLMCAVDRYTEGIEDEMEASSRVDEVSQATESPVPTPVPSPAPSKMWPADETKQTVVSEPSICTGLWSNVSSPEWARGPALSPRIGSSGQFSSPSPVRRTPSPQTSPAWNDDSIGTRKEVPAYDLWSSPSFDFHGVLTRPGSN